VTNEQITTTNIAKVFGNVKVFKTTNPFLLLVANKEIKTLYWKINGFAHIINNELMLWFIKGWIAKQKGHLVNWAIVVATTTKEKV
jgi:hypothetical protein